eukprot:tig00000325_g24095.t1
MAGAGGTVINSAGETIPLCDDALRSEEVLHKIHWEQLHLIQTIQPFGVLFVLELGADGGNPGKAGQQRPVVVRQVSANVSDLLGASVTPADVIGKDVSELYSRFLPATSAAVRQRIEGQSSGPFLFNLADSNPNDPGGWIGNVHPPVDGLPDIYMLEVLRSENGAVDSLDILADSQHAVQCLQDADSADSLCQVLVKEIAGITGFDRVMVYKFDAEGQVIAESLKGDQYEPYMNLKYPATDVPFVARALYCKTKFRLIPDVEYQPVPLVSAPAQHGGAGLLVLRDRSGRQVLGPLLLPPLRAQGPPLRNMGVRASLSFAIVQDDKCWGLCCCHHYEPRALPYHVMAACVTLVSMFQASMQAKTHKLRQEYEMKARSIQAQILNQSCVNLDYVDALINCPPSVLDLVESSGASIVAGGDVYSLGVAPSKDQVLAFTHWLRDETASAPADEIWMSTCLVRDYPAASAFKHVASGVLAVAISREQSEFVLWWRSEVSKAVHWAGTPDKSFVVSSKDVLHPRNSFERWTALVTDRCEVWSDADIAAARIFRITVGDLNVRISAELKVRGEILGKLNAELEESNSKLRYVASELTTLIQTVPVPVIGMNKTMRIDEWNPACEKYFGFNKQEILGSDFVEKAVIYEQREAFTKALALALAGKQVKDVEFTVFANGKRTEFSLHAAPRIDSNGQVEGVVAVCQDITERKEVAKAEVRAAQARSANDAKSMFLATVSHEMRTPLNGILGMLQLAMDSESLPKVAEDYVKRAFQSGEHLLSLISDILDISQIESGKMQLRHMAFDIRSLLRSAINLISPKAEAKGLKVSSCLSDDFPIRVIGDSDRLRQVLINLCSNAVKYTRKGRITVTCSIEEEEEDHRLEKKTARLRFEIKDTGIGIRESDLKILFTLFTRIREENFQDPGGTGLGLAICKQLVQLMNGEIGVQSNYGKGSVFWFVIPFEIAADANAAIDDGEDEFNKPAIEVHRSAVILLAEDNEFNMEVARVLLQNAGHVVFTARNGLEAVDLFARRVRLAKSGTSTQAAFDLVLMDCEMPVMSGYEAVRNIRTVESSECVARTPVIALTAHAMKEHSEKCFSSGMDDYITKPISKEVLLQTVAKHMQARESRRIKPGASLAAPACSSSSASRPGSGVASPPSTASDPTTAPYYSTSRRESIGGGSGGGGPHGSVERKSSVSDFALPPAASQVEAARSASPARYAAAGRTPPRSPPGPSARGPRRPADDSVVDAATAVRVLGGSEELFRSLLGKFSHSSLETVNSIELALISRQWSEVRRLAHSLKGSASYIGAQHLANAGADLQHAVEMDSLEQIRSLAKVVRLEYERVRHWIAVYLAN